MGPFCCAVRAPSPTAVGFPAAPRPPIDLVALHGFGAEIDDARVTGLAVTDLDGDRQPEVLVAWYVTDFEDPSHDRRRLTILRPDVSGRLVRSDEIDLFVPDPFPPLSIFRNGTGEVVVGDFDGDGDPDVAVLPFFGDELWIFENVAGWLIGTPRFVFGINSPLQAITPPRGLAADIDGDGRDELVYLSDPLQRFDGQVVHFWRTDEAVADMQRVDWEGDGSGVLTSQTRALALADFDGDGRVDLCFGGVEPPLDEPVLTFWHDFEPATGRFTVELLRPAFNPSDIAVTNVLAGCPPALALADPDGTSVVFWAVGDCGPAPGTYVPWTMTDGLAGLSPGLGVALQSADLDGDGLDELLVRQKRGSALDPDQLQVLAWEHLDWVLLDPGPFDTSGLDHESNNQILRPRAITTADVVGNRLPEVLAGFGPTVGESLGEPLMLAVGVWHNGCLGDVNRDGVSDFADLVEMLAHLGCSAGNYDPDADLNKDGCVDLSDVTLLLADAGCGFADQ